MGAIPRETTPPSSYSPVLSKDVPGVVHFVDTQVIYYGMSVEAKHERSQAALIDMAENLCIRADRAGWHNAGNDAKVSRHGIRKGGGLRFPTKLTGRLQWTMDALLCILDDRSVE